MKFLGPFITQDLPGGEDVWAIHEPFMFIDSDDVNWFVPAGFITDGASIPKLFWSIVGHPRETDIGQAACLHDMLYRYANRLEISKKRADEILIEGMECLYAPAWKRKAVYLGLAIGGGAIWKRYRALESKIIG